MGATSTSVFNVRDAIRKTIEDSGETDLGVIADKVRSQIPADVVEEVLAQHLRSMVRDVVNQMRTSHTRGVVTPGRSWKGEAIRDGWQRRLNDLVHVGDTVRKPLRLCTFADLMAAADERQALAARNAAWARTYKAFADAVAQAAVDTFGELPAESQMYLLGGAA